LVSQTVLAKSRSVFPFLHAGEHGLRGLPDESGDEGEDNGVGEGRGGEGGGEVQENPRDERVEENGGKDQLGPHCFVLLIRKYLCRLAGVCRPTPPKTQKWHTGNSPAPPPIPEGIPIEGARGQWES